MGLLPRPFRLGMVRTLSRFFLLISLFPLIVRLDKIRLKTRHWEPLDHTPAWDWGSVRQVFLLIRPSLTYERLRTRIGESDYRRGAGHWVLAVYVRRTNVLHVFDSREYSLPRDQRRHLEAVQSILIDYGLFSTDLFIETPETLRREGPRIKIAIQLVRPAFS